MTRIRQPRNRACSQSVVSTRKPDKLPVTDEWRERLVAARKAANLSQQEMARRSGMAQATYSRLELGQVAASDRVLRISEIVGIAPPRVVVDEFENEWLRLGQALRARSPRLFRRALALVEAMAGGDGSDDS